MAKLAKYKYKCRLCGEVFVAAGSPWKFMPMDMARAITGDGSVGLLTIHGCGDGSSGIADLQGACKDER